MSTNAICLRPKTVQMEIGKVKAHHSVAWKGDILVLVKHVDDVTWTISMLEEKPVSLPSSEEVTVIGTLALLWGPVYERSEQRTTVRRVE